MNSSPPHAEGQDVPCFDLPKAVRRLADQLVPGLVPEIVIDVFQIVHVHVEHGQGLLLPEQALLQG